ncbi:MAG: polymerase III subunit beta protein [candidate division TM6 bacterium GW2011_GWF2_38_10]|nr:MAG: polymerase III subunit beta protein [candidate division TM6 bacterium GW2011_GWF2_38_10]
MNRKFFANQKELLAILASMQPICSKRTSLDVTESIFFNVTPRELTLKATDLEISLQANMPIDAELSENMQFLISGKRIFELVKELDGEIEFIVAHNELHLKSGGVDLMLNIKDASEFPPFPERIENMLNMQASFLLSMLNKVAFLIPQNNANMALNGMLLEFGPQNIGMVATDGHCLVRVISDKYTLSQDYSWLMPKRAVLELKKLLELNTDEQTFLGTCGNQLVFSGKNFNFFTKLISDPFPQYQPVLNKDGFIPARMHKDSFLKTLKRTGCLLAGQFVSTHFLFSEGSVKVSLHNKEVGKLEETLVLQDFAGGMIESRFYSPYLLNGLQVFADEKIQLFIKNAAKPIIFQSQSTDFDVSYLVMPISMTQAEG